MANKIPMINITSEIEDDDNNALSLIEALTDIEDLEDTKPKIRKPKLLIKLPHNGNDSYTDIEDFEGSDVEDEPKLAKHATPINLDNALVDYGVVQECCDVSSNFGKAKLHSQQSIPISNKPKFFSIVENLTDIEYFSGDEEVIKTRIKDSVVPRYFDSYDIISTKDTIKYDIIPSISPCVSPYLSEGETKMKRKMPNMKLSVSLPQIYNLTDVEMLDSEYGSEECSKPKSKQYRKCRSKKATSNDITDIEELCTSSDQEHKKSYYGRYLDTATAKVKKSRKAEKNKKPVEVEPLTDIEEIQYSSRKDEYNSGKMRGSRKMCMYVHTHSSTQHKRRQTTTKATTSHEKSPDTSDSDDKKFLQKRLRKIQNISTSKSRPRIVCSTEVEDFEASDDEISEKNYLRVRNQIKYPDITDEEDLATDNYLDNIPEMTLHAPKRELITIKEVVNNSPTVVIAPLNEDLDFGLNFSSAELTDLESLSGDENVFSELPDIPDDSIQLEGGSVEEHESVIDNNRADQHLRAPSPQMQEVLTDTEDIIIDSRNTLLYVMNPHNYGNLTDTEDVYFSDHDGKVASPRRNNLTDVEQFELSEDDDIIRRDLCSTPQHLREIGCDTIVVKESRELFGKYNRQDIKKNVKQIDTPLNYEIESDEMVTSYDEDSRSATPVQICKLHKVLPKVKQNSSRVMYLKGGNFSANLVDSEDFPSRYDEELSVIEEGNMYVVARSIKSIKTYKVMLLAEVISRTANYKNLTMYYINHGYDFPINKGGRETKQRKLPDSIAKLVSKYDSINSHHVDSFQNLMTRILRVNSNFALNSGSIKEKFSSKFTEWRATEKSKDKPATSVEKEAVQGLQPTPTAKYLASSEELSLDSPKTDKHFTNDKDALRQTNATDQKTKTLSRDSSREDINRGDDKKHKKGFFGTLRSMVSKSQDRSDSESEKSLKKDKKTKKDKKKKPTVKPPERPPRKPKLPTPPPLEPEDRPEFRDIPFVEYSPHENEDSLPPGSPVIDLDISEKIKTVANDIVSDIITTSESKANDIIENAPSPSGKHVVIGEEITKKIEPKIYESGEYLITVSPTSPPRIKDFLKTEIEEIPDNTKAPIRPMRKREHIYEDIDEQLDIKKLTSSLIQSEIYFSGWADDPSNRQKPQDIKERTQSLKREKKQAKLFGFFGKKSSKDVEDSDIEKEIIEKQDREPSKERTDKLDSFDDEGVKKSGFFGIFGKKNKKEDAEKLEITQEGSKHDNEEKVCEMKVESDQTGPKEKKKTKKEKIQSESEDESESKKSLFGLFGKRGKKDIKGENELAEPVVLSEVALKNINDTTSFLKEEIERFHDVKPVFSRKSPERLITTPADLKHKSPKKLKKELDKRELSVSDEEPEATRKSGIFDIFGKKKRKSKDAAYKAVSELRISDEVAKQIIETNSFLQNEIQAYDNTKYLHGIAKIVLEHKDEPDITVTSTVKTTIEEYTPDKNKIESAVKEIEIVKQVETYEREIVAEPVITKETVTVDDVHKKTQTIEAKLVQIDPNSPKISRYIKLESEETKEVPIPKAKAINKEVLMDMISSSKFLKDEIEHFEDVRIGSKEATIVKKGIKDKDDKFEIKIEKPEVTKKDGFLGIFGKKQQGEDVKKDAKKIDSAEDFKRTEVFRPITPVKEHQQVHEKSSKHITTSAISSDNDDETARKHFLETLLSTSNFISNELTYFNDVRSVTQQLLPKKKKEKEVPASIEESISNGEKTVKPLYSQDFLQIINKTDTFLSNEVSKFDDVKETIRKQKVEPSDTKEIIEKGKPLKAETKKAPKNLETQQKPTREYSNNFAIIIKDTSTFLSDEVTHFEDVKIITPEVSTFKKTKQDNEKARKDKKESGESEDESDNSKSGRFFKLFGRKDKKEKADTVTEVKDMTKTEVPYSELEIPKPKLAYTEEFEQILTATNIFLKDEIKHFEDVTLAVKEYPRTQEEDHPVEKKTRKMLKKAKRESSESGDESDTGKSGIFKLFGKKDKKFKEETDTKKGMHKIDEAKVNAGKPSIYSAEFQQTLFDTNKFLSDEVTNFEDVKPLADIKVETVAIKELQKKDKKQRRSRRDSSESGEESEPGKSSGFFNFFAKKDKKDSDNKFTKGIKDEKNTTVETTQEKIGKSSLKKAKKQKSDEKSFFDIFGKKDKQDKETQKIIKPELSTEVIKNMQNTEKFLKEEVDHFHDVKISPLIKSDIDLDSTMTIAEISKSVAPKTYENDDFKVVVSPAKETKVKEFHLNVKDTIDKMEKEILSTKQSDLPLDYGIAVLSMKPLEDNYDEAVLSQCPVKAEQDITTHAKTQIIKFSDKTSPPPLSEEALRNMINTSNFLNQEITRFEDVRPVIVKEVEVQQTDKKRGKEKHQKSIEDASKKSSFFGLFNKKEKKSEEKEESDIPAKKTNATLEQEIIPNVITAAKPQSTSLDFPETIHFTNNFLNNEIKNYDDVKPITTKTLAVAKEIEITPIKYQDEQKEEAAKGKSIFGLFTKKSDSEKCTMKEKRERRKSGSPFGMFTKKSKEEEKPEVRTEEQPITSENIIHHIYETKNFLNAEILHYEDVKLVHDRSEKDFKKVVFVDDGIQKVQQTEKVIVVIREEVPITKIDEEAKTPRVQSSIVLPESKEQVHSDMTITLETKEKVADDIVIGSSHTQSKIVDQQFVEKKEQRIAEYKQKDEDQISEISSTLRSDVKKRTKKSGGFFTKLGGKITGKGKEIKDDFEDVKENVIVSLTDSKNKITDQTAKQETISESIIPSAADGPVIDVKEKEKELNTKVVKVTENPIKHEEFPESGEAKLTKRVHTDTKPKAEIRTEIDDGSDHQGVASLNIDQDQLDKKKTKEKQKPEGFFSKLGDKISGKTKHGEEGVEETIHKPKQSVELSKSVEQNDVTAPAEKLSGSVENEEENVQDGEHKIQEIKPEIEDKLVILVPKIEQPNMNISVQSEIKHETDAFLLQEKLEAVHLQEQEAINVPAQQKEIKSKEHKKSGGFLTGLGTKIFGPGKEKTKHIVQDGEESIVIGKEMSSDIIGSSTRVSTITKAEEDPLVQIKEILKQDTTEIDNEVKERKYTVGEIKEENKGITIEICQTDVGRGTEVQKTLLELGDKAEKISSGTGLVISELSVKTDQVRDFQEDDKNALKISENLSEAGKEECKLGKRAEINGSVVKFREKIKKTNDCAEDTLNEALKETDSSITGLDDKIIETKSKIRGAVESTSTPESLVQIKDKVADKTKELKDDTQEKIGYIKQAIEKSAKQAIEEGKKGVTDTLKEMVTDTTVTTETISKKEAAKDTAKDASKSTQIVIEDVKQSSEKAKGKVKGKAKKVAQEAGTFFSNLGGKMLGATEKVKEDMDTKIVEVESAVHRAGGEAENCFLNTMETIRVETKQSVEDSKTNITEAIENGAESTSRCVKELQETMVDKAKDLTRSTVESTDKVTDHGQEDVDKSTDTIKTKEKTEEQIPFVSKGISGTAENVKDDIPRNTTTFDITSKPQDFTIAEKTKFEDTKAFLENVREEMNLNMSKLKENVSLKSSEIATGLKDKSRDLQKDVQSKLYDTKDITTRPIVEDANNIVDKIKGETKQTVEEAESFIAKLDVSPQVEKTAAAGKSADLKDIKDKIEDTKSNTNSFLSNVSKTVSKTEKTTLEKEPALNKATESHVGRADGKVFLKEAAEIVDPAVKTVNQTTHVIELGEGIGTSIKNTFKQTTDSAGSIFPKLLDKGDKLKGDVTTKIYETKEHGDQLTATSVKMVEEIASSDLGKSKTTDDESKEVLLDTKLPKLASTLFIEAEQIAYQENAALKQTLDEVSNRMDQLTKSIGKTQSKQDAISKSNKSGDIKSGSLLSEMGEKLFGKSQDEKDKKLKHTFDDRVDKYPLITSPTLPRRAESQRIPRGDIPYCVEVTSASHDLSSDDETYIVTEPQDLSTRISEKSCTRKPLFHIESEEDTTELSTQHTDSLHANLLHSLSDQRSAQVTDLDDYEDVISTDTKFTTNVLYDSTKSTQQPTATDIIEQKLLDIEKALGSLEQEEAFKGGVSEIKLKRVERKFERMASAAIEKDESDGKSSKMTSPEVEEKRETDYRHLVSQLSTEEVTDFQKEYAALWDEQTFSHSDEWDTLKTPDSLIEELPQGDVVYMGPVTLNKGNSVNKAGVEVDVIPIMRSPHPSPLMVRKTKRAKSELGFRSGDKSADDDRGSLPDLHAYKKGVIIDTILHAHPNLLLTPGGSTDSVRSEDRAAKSLGSTDSLSKGHIMNAVINWLERSSPFDSTQSINSNNTSIRDDTEPSTSKHDSNPIPNIFVSEDEVLVVQTIKQSPTISKKNKRKNKKSWKGVKLEVVQLTKKPTESDTNITTKSVPKPKPRSIKSPDIQPSLEKCDSKIHAHPISPVRDDTLDSDSSQTTLDTYSDKKKFWESITKEGKFESSTKKRMSLYEESATEKINIISKRTSVHEISIEPPVPKPRAVLQSSQSIAEVKEEHFPQVDKKAADEQVSEYKSSYQDPSILSSIRTQPLAEEKIDLEDKDGSDSDQDHSNNQSMGYENTGYISDSGDVEHYISDSEIEDRVPQIRDRQMSVFHPTATKKSVYERSMSLPTEDLYELSAKNVLLRKQYYENQIKKEMVEEQLMTELEEEASPERKTLSFVMEERSGSRTFSSETLPETGSIKNIAKDFSDTTKISPKDQTEEEECKFSERKSVKDLAKSFEESGSFISTKMTTKPKSEKDDVTEISKEIKYDIMVKDEEINTREIKPFERELKHMEESVDESTDVTMQDFETSEELGSKEIDEFSRKQYDASAQGFHGSSKLSLTTFDSELQLKPKVKDEDILEADVSEMDEKSEESKLTYASEIERDSIIVKDIEPIAEVQPPILTDKVKEDLEDSSEIEPAKSDASRITYASDSLEEVKDVKLNGKVIIHPSLEETVPDIGIEIEDKCELTMDKSVERLLISPGIPATCKDTEFAAHIQQSSTESEQSVFSDRSADLGITNYKEDQTSKPSDSMEVHVDKSEIEDSEKLAELEDTTDIETKSLDSLNAIEMSPKTSFYTEEPIPEITISLSGKQSRISEESDESEKKEKSEICQPEEHIEDTVWEVSIESHTVEEKLAETAKETIIERDDDLSSSVHDESDLGSEIHQDHSESASSDKLKSESHDEIEKLILESLQQQKISEQDAKIIASELLADIEAEIQKRDTSEIKPVLPELPANEISEYLRQLAETKGLDSREVQLVQSVLERKKRQLSKLSRGDTQASSMEITDEDLRYSGGEYSPSGSRGNILEAQIEHLEVERSVERKLSRELGLTLGDHFVLGRSDSPDIEPDDKFSEHKTEKDTKVTEKYQRAKERSEYFNKCEDTVHGKMEETEMTDTETKIVISEFDQVQEDKFKASKRQVTEAEEEAKNVSCVTITIDETIADDGVKSEIHLGKEERDVVQLVGKFISEEKVDEEVDRTQIHQETITTKELAKRCEHDIEAIVAKKEETIVSNDVECRKSEISTHKKISSSTVVIDSSHAESKTICTTVDVVPSENIPTESTTEDYSITTVIEVKRISSDESKSDEIKSPEDQVSTSSSGKKSSEKDKVDVILRKPKLHSDTSSSSPVFRPDRKSGVDFETYSSSGESHYQSFELDSGKSRPCSSDVEALVAAGSSEYESALTEQDVSSAHTHMTSYHTAVSSLSSKESMKSLDSESSGNLASIEVSEASETLVPSECEPGDVTGQTIDDISVDRAFYTKRQSTEISDSELILPEQGSIDVSDEDADDRESEEVPSRMKRSCEMTFQPELKILVPDSPQFEASQDLDERFGTSLDEGSVLSVSLSSTSSATALRTVIELAPIQGEKPETSVCTSGTSELLIDKFMPRHQHSISTSTHTQGEDIHIDSVTITTSAVAENGIQNVSTQVISQGEPKHKEEPFDPKKRGHRRCESTISSNILSSMSAEAEKRHQSDLAESDKYTTELSIKEGRSHEKKDVDETEKDDYYETEADQGFHRDLREGRYHEADYENDVFDISRPLSQVSKSDSERERITSTAYSDSELAELSKQPSEPVSDPIERPTTPEPCEECEIRDDTPEFSSEAQASVGELEQEYNSAIARAHEIMEIKKQILIEVSVEKPIHKEVFDKRDSQTGKLSTTSSEKSSFEEAEAEAAFSMVAHVSPAYKIKQICPILEDEDAEKHELETREKAQKEFERKRQLARDLSPGSIPDIKVTQHMAPLVDRGFHYPDLELEEDAASKITKTQVIHTETGDKPTEQKEKTPEIKEAKDIKETNEITGKEEKKTEIKSKPKEDIITELSEEGGEAIIKTVQHTKPYETPPSPTDSPTNSDSFEMLEKPDLIDDFVVIEEVAKEAHEMDTEGKSIKISSKKITKKADKEIEEYLVKSVPSPVTKMTDIKYYPDGSSSEELGFDFEESPPQPNGKSTGATGKSPRDYVYEYDRELEANRKWIEQQFQGNQAAMVAAGYGYEMEFERGPLEDIKEEDINDIDSSRIGSLSSQKEYGSSSIKDSYSSTPEYDVLAGRKYFTRSGEHDDVSMSSLQEFENLERAMSLENRRCIAGSQDSSSNGSFKNKFYHGRSGQGDDMSVSSLKEFEGLEMACVAAHKIEVKAKEEEAILAQIDEGPESIASETESCETMSGTDKKLIPESDDEDYEKRLFEIDEIIRQAQTNVERFIEIEKTESLGRGDSFEEVAKVPDLDLDTPIARTSITKIEWSPPGDPMLTSTDSLDLKAEKPAHHDSTDSLEQKTTAVDVMTASTDSIEFQAQKSYKDNIMSDSVEIREGDKSYMITSDSLEIMSGAKQSLMTSDSIDEDGSRIGGFDQSSSSTGKDFSSSVKDDLGELVERAGSIASTSTSIHASYQYENDPVYLDSFTSGGSNTMVSSTDSIGLTGHQSVDSAATVRKVWFDDTSGSSRIYTTEYLQDSRPYVTEVIEPCQEEGYTHTIHRRIELPPNIKKVTFTGPDADEQLRQFIENFGEGEEVHETEDVDKDGNVHIKRIVQKKFVMQTDQSEQGGIAKKTLMDDKGIKTIYTQKFDLRHVQDPTSIAGERTGESVEPKIEKTVPHQTITTTTTTTATDITKAQGARRRPLRYEISIDDQTEVDPREHDWRFSLPQHVETEETSTGAQQQTEQERPIQDQHMLSDEMKRLLKELEEESKK